MDEKFNKLVEKLKEKGIPVTVDGYDINVPLLFHEDLMKYANELGLQPTITREAS